MAAHPQFLKTFREQCEKISHKTNGMITPEAAERVLTEWAKIVSEDKLNNDNKNRFTELIETIVLTNE